jgi:HK97 family phage prohead protease
MKETRIAEIRAESLNDALILEGRAIVFDQETEINDPVGSYREIIKSGALNEADLSDVRLLFNHDLNRVPLARTPKTMTLRVDSVGMTIRATLPKTESAREIYEAVKRRDLTGMSFAFKVAEDSYDERTDEDGFRVITRTITKIKKIYDVSAVSFPANPATDIGVSTRSAFGGAIDKLTAERLESEKRNNELARQRLALKMKLLSEESK